MLQDDPPGQSTEETPKGPLFPPAGAALPAGQRAS